MSQIVRREAKRDRAWYDRAIARIDESLSRMEIEGQYALSLRQLRAMYVESQKRL